MNWLKTPYSKNLEQEQDKALSETRNLIAKWKSFYDVVGFVFIFGILLQLLIFILSDKFPKSPSLDFAVIATVVIVALSISFCSLFSIFSRLTDYLYFWLVAMVTEDLRVPGNFVLRILLRFISILLTFACLAASWRLGSIALEASKIQTP